MTERYVSATVFPAAAPSYGDEVVRAALATEGVREQTRNRGPEIDEWVSMSGLSPAGRYAWCMAWVYGMNVRAAEAMGGKTTCPRTASAVGSWLMARRRGLHAFTAADVIAGREIVKPGDQYVRVRRGKVRDVAKALAGRRCLGHTGIITSTYPWESTDGNTNDAGSREGDGVYTKPFDLGMPELVGFVRHALA